MFIFMWRDIRRKIGEKLTLFGRPRMLTCVYSGAVNVLCGCHAYVVATLFFTCVKFLSCWGTEWCLKMDVVVVFPFPLIFSPATHSMSGPGSVVGTATGYGLDGPGIESLWGARLSAPVQTSPGAYPAFCTMGTGFFPGVKSGRGVTLTPHPLLVPWSWKSRAISLLPLWAVRPVQILIACTRVHFAFTFTHSMACTRHVKRVGVVCMPRWLDPKILKTIRSV
jgi:hypothetical protein